MKSPQSIAENSFYDPAIDGLRGVAILSVIINHAMYYAAQDHSRTFYFPILKKIGEGGAGGVSLFFILSALTLMMSTSFRYQYEKSPKLAFYIRRAFRILPIWWGFILISVIIRNPEKGEILPHLFMYFGFIPQMNFTHVGWSLFVEETFYLFFPLIFVWLLTSMGALFFLLATVLLSDRILSLDLFNSMQWYLPTPRFRLLYHYVTFGLGILIFHLAKSRSFQFQKLTKNVHKYYWDIGSLLAISLYFLTESHSNVQILSCFVLVVAAMIDGTLTRRILSSKLLGAFGICCYSIYLFHGLFLFSIRYTSWFKSLGASPSSPDIQLIIGFVLTAAVSLVFGIFSFKYLEKPCVSVGNRIAQKLGLGRC